MMITDRNTKLFFEPFLSVLVGVICSYLLINLYAYATAYFPFSYEQILPASRTKAKYVFMLIQLVIFWATVLISVGAGSVILGRLISEKAIFKGFLLALAAIGSWTFWMYYYDNGHEMPNPSGLSVKNSISYLFEVLIVVITSCFFTSLAFNYHRIQQSPRSSD